MKKIFFFLFGVFYALVPNGCNSDDDQCAGKTTGETEVEINLKSTGTLRAAISEEDAIQTVDLLVFDASAAATEDQAVFLYSRYAWLKSGNTYRSTLKTGSSLNIYCAVNARALVEGSGIASGMTYAEVRALLVMTQPQQLGIANGLPMWGHAPLPSGISEGTYTNLGTIKLLRSVASTDVTVTAGNFVLEKGHIAFASDKGYLPYSDSKIGADNQATEPEVPAGTVTTAEWSYAAPAGTNAIENVFYLFENDADGTVAAKHYTKLILEGKWNGAAKSAFYPISFRRPDTNQKIRVTRNNKYVVIITAVNGNGFETIEEAKQAEDVNMDYEIIEWDQNSDGDIQIDGMHYFSIASKTALLSSQTGAVEELLFATNYQLSDISMKYNDTDTGVTGTIDTHPRFKVEVLERTLSGGKKETYFKITTKHKYATADNPATLIVTAGRIKYSLHIEQVQNNWEGGGDVDAEVTFP